MPSSRFSLGSEVALVSSVGLIRYYFWVFFICYIFFSWISLCPLSYLLFNFAVMTRIFYGLLLCIFYSLFWFSCNCYSRVAFLKFFNCFLTLKYIFLGGVILYAFRLVSGFGWPTFSLVACLNIDCVWMTSNFCVYYC